MIAFRYEVKCGRGHFFSFFCQDCLQHHRRPRWLAGIDSKTWLMLAGTTAFNRRRQHINDLTRIGASSVEESGDLRCTSSQVVDAVFKGCHPECDERQNG